MIVRGVVASFDERRGDGAVVSDGGERLYFHCVSIRDGSRRIEVGTPVRGRRCVGHVGHDEVEDLTAIE